MWLRLDARPFSPRPPPLVAQPCSVASSIVWACPTPPACASSATPFGFPLRPRSPSTVGRLEVSQIQATCVRTCMGSLTPGGPSPSRITTAECCLPSAPTASAPPTGRISWLNAQPVRTPINDPPTASRPSAYDSGPWRLAKPSTYGSFIHNTLLAHWRSPGLHCFTCVTACRSLCLRFVVVVAFHDARLDSRWLTGPCRGGNFTLWIGEVSSRRTPGKPESLS